MAEKNAQLRVEEKKMTSRNTALPPARRKSQPTKARSGGYAAVQMFADFDDKIVFENIQNGEINMSLSGLIALKEQAEQAKTYFTERTQSIKSYNYIDNSCEIEISYRAVLAIDFPNGLKKGQELNLLGKSIFGFEGDKIIRLTDIS